MHRRHLQMTARSMGPPSFVTKSETLWLSMMLMAERRQTKVPRTKWRSGKRAHDPFQRPQTRTQNIGVARKSWGCFNFCDFQTSGPQVAKTPALICGSVAPTLHFPAPSNFFEERSARNAEESQIQIGIGVGSARPLEFACTVEHCFDS